MPPKAKFTKEEIVLAALDIVRNDGLQSLTARALGDKLGSSARPVFTYFNSMEEVQQEVFNSAAGLYNRYVEEGVKQSSSFMTVGIQYIRFSIEEPELFRLLFMSKKKDVPDLTGIMNYIEKEHEGVFTAIEQEFGKDKIKAGRFYRHLWIYTHGIASLCVTKACSFTDKEIGDMLYEIGESLLRKMKSEEDCNEASCN
ncbi:MAG: TetR/AcrR family transcriptional regulator [Butyrivibrio sp.]